MKIFNCIILVFLFLSAPLIGQDTEPFDFMGSSDTVKVKKRFRVKEPVSLIGINTYISEGNGFNMPDEISLYTDQRIGKSFQWGLGIIDFRLGLNGKTKVQKLGLLAGVRWNLSYYRFENDFKLVKDAATFAEAVMGVDKEIKKHRLLGNYLSIPLMLDFNANPESPLKGIKFSVGYVHSILLAGNYKLKYEDKNKLKVKDKFNLNQNLGKFEARVGYGPISFYFQYGLDGLFTEGKGPDVIPISFGFVSGG